MSTRQEPPRKKSLRACLFCELSNHKSSDCRLVKTSEARKQKTQGYGKMLEVFDYESQNRKNGKEKIRNSSNMLKQIRNRLLHDSGSQRSYITKKAANKLGLMSNREELR